MSDSPNASGLDLARQALAAYKATAKAAPATPKAARRTRRVVRTGERRDPLALGATLNRLSGEQGWQVSLGGGDLLDRWAALCPQFADTVHPEGFDADHGLLVLRPSTDSTAATLRLLGGQLAKQINDKVGKPLVARIRILPVGHHRVSTPSPSRPATEEAHRPAPPVRTRETASPGYRQALEAARAHRVEHHKRNPLLQAAIEHQNAALAHPANREPQTAFTDYVAELERVTAQIDETERIRQAAIARKHAGDQPVRRAFDVA
ncbi:DciA family protein [Streptomyces sp. NPDC018584]|uniref:DciA family protein n=1 Tax=unclassified Streptomyces TaxID=2593676 RepID=UPI0037B936DB